MIPCFTCGTSVETTFYILVDDDGHEYHQWLCPWCSFTKR